MDIHKKIKKQKKEKEMLETPRRISQFLSYRWSKKKIKKRSKLQEENFLSFSILILSVIRKENKEAKERKRNARIFFLSQFLSYRWSEKKIKKRSKFQEKKFSFILNSLILSMVREENKEVKETLETPRRKFSFFLNSLILSVVRAFKLGQICGWYTSRV